MENRDIKKGIPKEVPVPDLVYYNYDESLGKGHIVTLVLGVAVISTCVLCLLQNIR